MSDGKWPVEKAVEWYQTQPWLRGCNFIPSTAINQLEMWQAETFDLETIYSWEDHYPNGREPPLWFHDILRPDGTPYRQEEKALIQEITRGDWL